ncbi:hypothetical protein DL764_004229 [Monosporascus ibericus]|uniref:Uncharacterized protein n=1 Tax=Monosporascus ibericus TaxID=155417 RepID=A0A4Q4THM3_9PEZI|nr:hypothetical protein DL764_004229 [Monosporascus ibericus]
MVLADAKAEADRARETYETRLENSSRLEKDLRTQQRLRGEVQAADKEKGDEAEGHKKEVNERRKELETANKKKDEEAEAHQNMLWQMLKAANKKKGKDAETYKEDMSELRRRIKKLRGLLVEKRRELGASKEDMERQLRTARHNFKLMHERWLGTANRLQGIAKGSSRRVAELVDEVVADKDCEISRRGASWSAWRMSWETGWTNS